VVDPSGEQTSRKVRRFCYQVDMTLRILEESTQWANLAELYIRIFKEAIRKDLRRSDSRMILWDYCAERRARIQMSSLEIYFSSTVIPLLWLLLGYKVMYRIYVVLVGIVFELYAFIIENTLGLGFLGGQILATRFLSTYSESHVYL